MSKDHPIKTILVLSMPLTAFVVITACVGLFTPGFYAAETLNWQAQSVGQDMVNLFLIAPCLLVTSILAYRNNKTATVIWGAVVLYLTYTFTVYCFDVHFNKLFILYCFCLGLSFYSFVFFLVTQSRDHATTASTPKKPVRFTAVYFLLIAAVFYALWLKEIIPAVISKTTPASVTDTGLFTNGVHVIDLSVFLPAIFITGILLLQKKTLGFILAPVLLAFFVLMNVTIGLLVVVMKSRGLSGDLPFTVIMGVLAFISLVLLILFLKNDKGLPAMKTSLKIIISLLLLFNGFAAVKEWYSSSAAFCC